MFKSKFTRSRTHLLILGILFIFATAPISYADNYTWISRVPNAGDEMQLVPEDTGVCKLYEDNLRHFTRKKINMTCYRPIAEEFKDRIEDVTWEDLDPEKHEALFKSIYAAYTYQPFGNKSIAVLKQNLLKNGSYVFRRAITPELESNFLQHNLNPLRLTEKKKFWIVQFGANPFYQNLNSEITQCHSLRPKDIYFQTRLKLYMSSSNLDEFLGDLADPIHPSNNGQYLKLIDQRLFVENMYEDGSISVFSVETDRVAVLGEVCDFLFKPSKKAKPKVNN